MSRLARGATFFAVATLDYGPWALGTVMAHRALFSEFGESLLFIGRIGLGPAIGGQWCSHQQRFITDAEKLLHMVANHRVALIKGPVLYTNGTRNYCRKVAENFQRVQRLGTTFPSVKSTSIRCTQRAPSNNCRLRILLFS